MVAETRIKNMYELSFLPALSKDEILKELELSRIQAATGQLQDFDDALDEICMELDL